MKLTKLFLLFTLPFGCWCTLPMQTAHAVTGQVILKGGSDEVLRRTVEKSLTVILNSLDRQDLTAVPALCTTEGWDELGQLTNSLRLHNARPVHETRLLEVPGGYEVRNIKMQISAESMRGTVASPYQFLVFSLTRDGLISGVRFSLEDALVDSVLHMPGPGQLQDLAFRHQILQFIEIYRTAYNRGDLEYIERVFSDDAIIIVGRVIQEDRNSPTQSDRFKRSSLTRENIEFVRRSKAEYVDNLRRAFANNEYVHVKFDSISVVQHRSDQWLYGVTLKQEWRSSTYNDTGYVFLMLDFKKEDSPLIHVRSWQSETFSDGSTISLYDFELIR